MTVDVRQGYVWPGGVDLYNYETDGDARHLA